MKSWNSVHNLVVPALIAFVEAGWVWAWMSAVTSLTPTVPADIPFFAVLFPAVVAVAVSGGSARLHLGRIARLAVLVPAAVVEAALAAGIIGSLYEHGGFGLVAFHPWSSSGHVAAIEATIAWLVAGLAVARGTWLGFREATLSHAVRSFGVGGFAYILFFILSSVHHKPGTFHPSVGAAGTLLLISFPTAISVVALVHERELERTVLRDQRARPTLAWLGAVLVPMGAVAILGALIALVVGPLSAPIGHAIRFVVIWIARGLDRLAHLFGHNSKSPAKLPKLQRAKAPLVIGGNPHVPAWLTVTAAILLIAVAGVIFLLIVRALFQVRMRRQLGEVDVGTAEEEKESVFSWSHVLDQLRALLRRLFRRGRGPATVGGSLAAVGGLDPNRESVRRHYVRVLVSARAAGYGRGRAETARELEDRLGAVTDEDGASALDSVTAEYELVRYGEVADTEERLARVREHADALVALLEGSKEPERAQRTRPADWLR